MREREREQHLKGEGEMLLVFGNFRDQHASFSFRSKTSTCLLHTYTHTHSHTHSHTLSITHSHSLSFIEPCIYHIHAQTRHCKSRENSLSPYFLVNVGLKAKVGDYFLQQILVWHPCVTPVTFNLGSANSLLCVCVPWYS